MPPSTPANEDDFIRMQQEAIRRVREMQERARRTLTDAGMPIVPAAPEPFSAPPHQAPPTEPGPPPRAAPVPPPPPPPAPAGGLLRDLHLPLKNDQFLLMGMIYLLYRDGGDIYLILALVFILLS